MLVNINSKDLTVSYDQFIALDSINFSLTGEVFSLVGHNGSGKSTLIKTILDLVNINAGYIQISDSNGKVVLPSQMIFAPETGSVFRDISIKDYFKLWYDIRNFDYIANKDHIDQIFDRLEINNLMHKNGRELSKGQKRRVQAALGFIFRPALFLMDEPFDGLDISQTEILLDLIRMHKSDIAYLISTHRMEIVQEISDQIIILKEKKLLYAGDLKLLCANEADQKISFLAKLNKLLK